MKMFVVEINASVSTDVEKLIGQDVFDGRCCRSTGVCVTGEWQGHSQLQWMIGVRMRLHSLLPLGWP